MSREVPLSFMEIADRAAMIGNAIEAAKIPRDHVTDAAMVFLSLLSVRAGGAPEATAKEQLRCISDVVYHGRSESPLAIDPDALDPRKGS